MKNISKGIILKAEGMIPIRENQTISKKLIDLKDFHILLMSLDQNTDISPEFYAEERLYTVLKGEINFNNEKLIKNELILFEKNKLFGIETNKKSILLEIAINLKEDQMKNIEKGKKIKLINYLDYVEGAIANIDLVSKDEFKVFLMAFDAGEGLKPHKAPGDALVIALEGKAKLLVGDKEIEIESGEQIVFPANVTHNVTAITRFKMLLILSIDK
ncbi:Cupin domain-containing protein [Peptoniphilus asaccharolyticus DSM 20463]|uniref:Cupin domain-containing protein n=1 Tax=Peptoniphilus asaccharolyticus DSM 20463 TaxID=573058 RepID=A0A1W1V2W0_PEPAS|nr:cupin domain-containing protein [Peptoniphilus asaccharolyticus]MBL7576055.1 cupin domain-containing protein [Peptoniphilus asaccharolyticus]SMB87364.1 Cupin domain-containing protein [Peptoniphilus asaccharolyticus DSM 20463]